MVACCTYDSRSTHHVFFVVLVEGVAWQAALDLQVGGDQCTRPTQHAALWLDFHAHRARPGAQAGVVALQGDGDGWRGCVHGVASALGQQWLQPGGGDGVEGVLVDIGGGEEGHHDVLDIGGAAVHCWESM